MSSSCIVVHDDNVLAVLSEPHSGVSARATSIARLVDRLPPGEYVLELTKPTVKSSAWELGTWKKGRIQKNTLE